MCVTSVLFPPACPEVTIVIGRRPGDLFVAPSAGGPVATPLRATATVLGSLVPTGWLTFRLYFDQACTNEQVFVSSKAPALHGAATSDDYLPPVPEVYRWTVSYSGDANNQPVSIPCHAASTVVVRGPALPTVSTTSTTPAGSRYVPLTPARIEDTRTGAGGLVGPMGPGATVAVQVAGRGGVPADASAVVMNVTVTEPTAGGYLTLYTDGGARPPTANVNFRPGSTVPSLAVVELGAGGRVAMFNSDGDTHVIHDVGGYFAAAAGAGAGGRYQPLSPARIADSRVGAGGVRLGPGQSFDLQVTGQGGAPAAGVSAAALNVASTGSTADSYLTIHPTGEARPLAAGLTFAAGETVSNSAMAKLGAGGRVTIYNNAGETDVVPIPGSAPRSPPAPPRRSRSPAAAGCPTPACGRWCSAWPSPSPPGRAPSPCSRRDGPPARVGPQLRGGRDPLQPGGGSGGRRRPGHRVDSAQAHVVVDVAGWFG